MTALGRTRSYSSSVVRQGQSSGSGAPCDEWKSADAHASIRLTPECVSAGSAYRLPTRMKVLSLFTGAGGLDLGLERAGLKIAGCVERDDDCQLTIEANRPEWRRARPGDIHAHRPADVLSGRCSSSFSIVASQRKRTEAIQASGRARSAPALTCLLARRRRLRRH